MANTVICQEVTPSITTLLLVSDVKSVKKVQANETNDKARIVITLYIRKITFCDLYTISDSIFDC